MSVSSAREFTVGDILGEAQRLVASAPVEALAYAILTGAAGALSDIEGWERAGLLSSTVVSLGLGYVMTVALLNKGDVLHDGKKAGFWPYFGLGILTSLGIGFGSLLLLIPGLILWVRWSAAYAILFAEGRGVTDSMGESWDLTRAHFWQVLAALLIPLAIIAAGFAALFLFPSNDDQIPLAQSLMLNGAISIAGVLTTAIGIAVYSVGRGDRGDLQAVFD